MSRSGFRYELVGDSWSFVRDMCWAQCIMIPSPDSILFAHLVIDLFGQMFEIITIRQMLFTYIGEISKF